MLSELQAPIRNIGNKEKEGLIVILNSPASPHWIALALFFWHVISNILLYL